MIQGGLIVPRRFVIPILLLLFSSIAFADYHYASHTGSNTYPYISWETAADSITAAMRAADPYDTVYIGAGDYNETMNMGEGDSCLTFIGAGIDSTHCFTSNMAAIWYVANRTSANHISYSQAHNHLCLSMRAVGTSVLAKDCRFEGYKAILGGGDSVVAENCQFIDEITAIDASFGVRKLVFRNNYFRTLEPFPVFSVFFSTALIENNIFISNYVNPHGEFFGDMGPGDTLIFDNNYIDNFSVGPDYYYLHYGEAINNSARRFDRDVRPFPAAFEIVFGRPGGNINFKNNSISQGAIAIKTLGDTLPEHLTVAYNNFWDNIGGNFSIRRWDTTDTIGNFNAYPMFLNPDSFDVHLQAYSPLIDAGDPNILDVDGTRSDIGCYGGPGGCSYVYLDLAPQIPDSISGHVVGDIVNIVWRCNYEADFNRYQIYRDTVSGFTPSIHNMIAEPETAFYQDIITNPYSSYYYKLTSVDNQHNASDYSDELAVIFSGIPPFSQDGPPRYAVISTAYPNPFNSQINIVYSASNLGPQPPEIKLEIFDIQGRVVRTLVNERKPCGTYRAIWDGKDDHGEPVASGSYLARLTQWDVPGGDFPIKITLVK